MYSLQFSYLSWDNEEFMKILKNHAVSILTFIIIILTSSISAVPAEAYSSFTRTLSVGAQGISVSALQTILTAQQVYSGPVTGYFGPLTRNGVAALQNKYGLEQTGTLGPKTLALLNQLSAAPVASNANTGGTVAVAPAVPTPIVVSGATPKPTAVIAATTKGTNAGTRGGKHTGRIGSTISPVPVISTPTTTPKTNPIAKAPTTPTSTPVSVPVIPSPTPVVTPPVVTPPPAVVTPAPVPTPVASGLQWGVFAGSGSPSVSSLTSTLGKSPNIVATFVGWPDSFPTNFSSTCTNNQSLLIFWENYGYSVDSIIAGSNDSYIKSFAQSAAASGCPVILSPFHEMNGNWDDWDGTVGNNSPAKLIAAWKHIHDIFVAANATNVKFAWAMNSDSVPNVAGNQFSDYYPGAAYVDYVGVDGFNFGNPWQTFGQVFDSAMSQMQTYNKPIYIFSMGSVAGSLKASWITEGLGSHVKSYPNLKGWVYFNENSSGTNWLINSDAASLAAFKTVLP